MITAVILAAGESKRMGQPKMLLPWGSESVLTHVISVFQNAGVSDIVIVTGGARAQVESLVSGLHVRTVHNKEYSNGEMLSSLQCGVKALTPPPLSRAERGAAMLIGLGDQPQVQERSVRMVCEAFRESRSNLVIPSYQMRRGHPWLVARPLWDALLQMKSPLSPRDFINAHQAEVEYVTTDDSNILADLDTPEEYQKWRP
ncbi:MAG: nucleotidyltransferase family protein [Anaerolineales bacterium]|nr:nucleotidyltransferase family protein [Anaerolineales bacterium]